MSSLPPLPHSIPSGLESFAILRQVILSNRYLAELKGALGREDDGDLLVELIGMQESKDSSTIENIITTRDALFQSDLLSSDFHSPEAEEVCNHLHALRLAWTRTGQTKVMRLDDLLAIQGAIIGNRAGLRRLPGMAIKNRQTGEVIYVPPQDPVQIAQLTANFLEYYNRAYADAPDPLVRMAILHYQFESIHPFYDGNGRTGRILNLIYLVHRGLLDLPVLYLSRYIVRNKPRYYRGLQAVRDEHAWESWVLYMLRGIEEMARETLDKIGGIRDLMKHVRQQMQRELSAIYTPELFTNIFRHPYTKIEFLQRDLEITRQTATKYLDLLAEANILKKTKSGRNNYYVNEPLVGILSS